MEQSCVFKFRYGTTCDEKAPLSETTGIARIETIINASKLYWDTLHVELETKVAENDNFKTYYHRNCVSRYTSKTNLAKLKNNESASPVKRLRRSTSVFDFKRHCLYCGNACELNKDPKNPQRWRPAFLCRSTLTEHGDRPYKEYLLDKCHSRNDHWANEVQTRIKAAVSDLHVVDARYRKDCMSIFVRNRCLADNLKDTSQTDEALQDVIEILQADRSRIWNSIELFKEYQDNHGCALTRCRLVEELRRNIGGDLVVLTNPGYASIIAFHKNAALMLKLVKADDESDDIGRSVSILANHVVKECKSIACDKSVYQMHVDMDIAAECASSTLLNLQSR